jgi:uncharacterized cupin superfamily protein
MEERRPVAIEAAAVPLARTATSYPELLRSRVAGRVRRALGDFFGLTHFGVNLTRIPPGAASALRHAHSREDELVYILEGEPTLVTNAGETPLRAGMCAGFKAGSGDAHHLVNKSARDVVYLEIGDRNPGDTVLYPGDDLGRAISPEGRRIFVHGNGSPY